MLQSIQNIGFVLYTAMRYCDNRHNLKRISCRFILNKRIQTARPSRCNAHYSQVEQGLWYVEGQLESMDGKGLGAICSYENHVGLFIAYKNHCNTP